MLEDWAWGHIAHSDLYLKLFSVAWMVLGGLLGALFHRGSAVISRAPYFALSSFVVLGIATLQLIWVPAGQAMLGGWLFWIVALDAVMTAAAGYALVALGQARSRDAYGHSGAGIVSLVPVANLWLLFTPGQEPSLASPGTAALRGGMGVFVGLAMLALSRAVEAQALPAIEAGVLAVSEDPALTDRFLELELARSSPAQILRDIADQTEVPQKFDSEISLMEVTAVGQELTYTYHLSEPGIELDYTLGDDTRRTICSDAVFSRLLDGGARVSFVYLGPTGAGTMAEVERFSVAAADCRV